MLKEELNKYKKAWQKHFAVQEKQRDRFLIEVRRAAGRCAQTLINKFGAKNVYLFGSVKEAGGFSEKSDLDLAVEGLAADKYFSALACLKEQVPAGLEIDLVPLEDAFPELKKLILSKGEALDGK